MGRPKESDTSSRLEMRIDEKLKYLAEVGARAKGMSLRQFLEWAVERTFTEVELRSLPQRFRPSMEVIDGKMAAIDYSEEDARDREQQVNYTLACWQDTLWQETPLKRINALISVCHAISSSDMEQDSDRLLSPEQSQIWQFLWSSDEFLEKTERGKALNYRYIEDNWQSIRERAMTYEIKKRSK